MFQRFKKLLWFFTKQIYQLKDILGRSFADYIFNPFSTFGQKCKVMLMNIQENLLSEELIRSKRKIVCISEQLKFMKDIRRILWSFLKI